MKHSFCAMLIAVALIVTTTPVQAQFLPQENHYKVYETTGPSIVEPVQLTDQFGGYAVDQLILEKFANPVEKNGEPMVDPMMHQTWWRLFLSDPIPIRGVKATDQFGTNVWTVYNPAYLVNPALKNTGPDDPIPMWNHYLCYDAALEPIGIQVTLVDQFGTQTTLVLEGRYFCNPVEKVIASGEVYPIVDPSAHLTCYTIEPFFPPEVITALDQFGYWTVDIGESTCLCAPANKEDVVGTEEGTWGRIKALYR
jgi:hypothetical protein